MAPADSEDEPRLTTEEDLQAICTGKVTAHNAPITLAEYDPQWPGLFDREAARIRAILGGTAVRVEHVGSTSVPGLAAKPIIDILLAVPDSADEPAYAAALQAAGYVLRMREPGWFEHRLFNGPDTDINLHMFTIASGTGAPAVPPRPAVRPHRYCLLSGTARTRFTIQHPPYGRGDGPRSRSWTRRRTMGECVR